MNSYFKSIPRTKIVVAFLAAALVVAAVAYAGSYHGLPHLSWANETNPGEAYNPLPGIGPDTIPDIVSRVSPAVVRIDTTEQSSGSGNLDPFFNDPFFRQFFGNQNLMPSQPRVSRGLGSGFIVSSDGYILTNEHVINGADAIEVTLAGQDKAYPARKVGSDKDLDLAVLKIDAGAELPTVPLGNSDSIRVGDWVIAIGNPYGLDHTVTVGVISAKGRPMTVQDRQYKNLLQTDASINPGNSGGPLLNLNGEVVGINTAINAQAQGIGFAIPSSTVKSVFDDLVNKGGVAHPWLGVYLQSVTNEIAQYYGLKDLSGALIAQVVEGGPAAKAGLQRGDVITGYNGSNVSNPNNLIDLVNGTQVGSQVEINFVRQGNSKSVIATIEAKN
ncbi:MAG: putative serine protease HtrA [Pelotomaculum sp. PtaB.Bin013]|uniref:Trypsin-like peptidase domain-containing protein n=1 Tax=Pelotomaculum isophthalicicum JI TaxID=947010 RepID=A0A9X4H313_9FIRM|nr:trypsin-like peptidase domain-containing protein [Pelotomaculum isophthalicicum]MDF9409336.1 trypsin-like peptidase domain-containing protein [Pelotomaculum isophthalicicum JI]OPX91839.1 MAG: putative serine protease HtrA [Pelotomaculum sp. PtaB.Bin013]